jgi:hypothetical protein
MIQLVMYWDNDNLTFNNIDFEDDFLQYIMYISTKLNFNSL